MTMPNFLIIGAAKAGTTSLYKYLEEHPEVYVSPNKEPRFFAVISSYQKIIGNDPALKRLWSSSVTTLADYKTLFKNVQNEKAIGEASPIYLWSPDASKYIKEYIPQAKMIVILRHPVDRAFSHYLHNLKIGFEKNVSFEEALADDETRHYAEYLPQGHYTAQLERYFALFPPEQIKIVLYDDLVEDTVGLMRSIYQYLGVDTSFQGNVHTVHNASGIPKSRFIDTLANNRLSQSLRKSLPNSINDRIGTFLKSKNTYKPNLSRETAKRLNELFEDEIRNLQKLIGRDLEFWRDKYSKPLKN